MLVSLQIMRCFSALSSSSSSSCCSYSSNYECRAAPLRITCCSRSASVHETLPLPPRPPTTITNEGEDKRNCTKSGGSGVEVPRQRYISVSKSGLLDAIVSTMFPSQDEDEEEARQFLSLSQCLDSILHAEHKSILEEMRADFDLTSKTVSHDDFSSLGIKSVANQDSDAFMNNSLKSDSMNKDEEDEDDSDILMPSDFTLDFKLLFDFSLNSAKRNPIKSSRVSIPGRFQRAFMKLLYSAEFEELSPRDLMLTSALNTDYLLTLPIYVDWKKASESSAIIFRRGYATERQKGLLIPEKLDYLQSKLLQSFFLLIAKPLGRFGVWLNEFSKAITQKQDIEVLANKFKLWLKELSLSLNPHSYEEQISDDLQGVDILSSDFPIWGAAQRAVTRYEEILSEVGPRERLLRRFLAWIGLLPSNPKQTFNLDPDSAGSESILSPNVLSRISFSDIWKPASPKSCGNDLTKMIKTAVSILFSQSILQEPAFQELILLYTEEIGERETTDQAEVPSLQMKIYERIPIPDLPVVFPHKKLSLRILDTVRLDVATILGLLAYFFSYKFEDILSSPSAIFLDVIPASALVIYVTRVVLGYKQTRDRYQLLVNRTLYEKTVASGFGCIHFLIDASEQQQYKEAILVYATLLKQENGQVTSIKTIEHKCETFIYNMFQEKVDQQSIYLIFSPVYMNDHSIKLYTG
ncbi:hypothetical protein BUALT_Bualt14G0000200 [Buddleja alternifolia]|uniref:Uncharacterized protein n=1 Tax=Buddleja alternifolia TaxID=168488 RepID=A0AAV6WQS7_9LAMI|nr:hypothetical protein BUALT_Bualt14G0000200 [Buddleja alternifolia]